MITNAQNALLVVSPAHLDCEQYFHPEATCLYYQDNEAAYRNITAVTMKASVEIDSSDENPCMRLLYEGMTYAHLVTLTNGTKVYSVSPDGKHRHIAFITGPIYPKRAQFIQSFGRVLRKPIDSGTPAAE